MHKPRIIFFDIDGTLIDIKCRRGSGWMHWRSSADIMTKHI